MEIPVEEEKKAENKEVPADDDDARKPSVGNPYDQLEEEDGESANASVSLKNPF